MGPFKDIGVDLDDMVATIEIRRPPHNFFDIELIRQIADACEALDKDAGLPRHRAGGAGHGVLRRRQARRRRRRAGRAGASGPRPGRPATSTSRRCASSARAKPIVGAIHGAAVGGGLGLALVPDLRVTCPEARFCANFTRLGFHPGFGLTAHAAGADRAVEGGADVLHQPPHPRRRGRAHGPRRRAGAAGRGALRRAEARRRDRRVLAARRAGDARDACARASPTACARRPTSSSRSRRGCAQTEDFKEGVNAVNERRMPKFVGR